MNTVAGMSDERVRERAVNKARAWAQSYDAPSLRDAQPCLPVFVFGGCSGSGKTRLMTATIGLLDDWGFRVGAVKYAHHGFDIDRRGKDSWKMREAGAASVLLASPTNVALMEATPEPRELGDLVSLFAGRCDLVLVEGHGAPRIPQVEVWRRAVSESPMLPTQSVLALVTDDEVGHPAPRISPERTVEVAKLVLTALGLLRQVRLTGPAWGNR